MTTSRSPWRSDDGIWITLDYCELINGSIKIVRSLRLSHTEWAKHYPSIYQCKPRETVAMYLDGDLIWSKGDGSEYPTREGDSTDA